MGDVFDNIDPDNGFPDELINCEYFDRVSFNSRFVNSNFGLKIVHENIRSINKNWDEFMLIFHLLL
jgi:hypothetical protein